MNSCSTERALIVFFDLPNYMSFTRSNSDSDVFEALNELYQMVDESVYANGGRVIKYIGDAGLVVFPEEKAEEGILSFLRLKEEKIDAWIRSRLNLSGQLVVNCHVGEVSVGKIGGSHHQAEDVIGSNVNLCATLGKRGLTLSPQAFRSLGKEARAKFKKYTPPITYHPQTGPQVGAK